LVNLDQETFYTFDIGSVKATHYSYLKSLPRWATIKLCAVQYAALRRKCSVTLAALRCTLHNPSGVNVELVRFESVKNGGDLPILQTALNSYAGVMITSVVRSNDCRSAQLLLLNLNIRCIFSAWRYSISGAVYIMACLSISVSLSHTCFVSKPPHASQRRCGCIFAY